MKKTLSILASAVGLFAMTSAAHAVSVESQFYIGKLNHISDNSAEYLLNSVGGGAYATDNGDTILAAGDRLRGWFNLSTVENLTDGGPARNFGTAGVNEFTGIFDIVVTAKIDSGVPGPGRYTFIFGPSGFLPAAAGAGAMVAMYQQTLPGDYTRLGGPDDAPGSVAEETLLATASNGSFVWSFGFLGLGGATEGWTAISPTDDVSVVGATPSGTNGGTVNFALNRIMDATGIPLAKVPNFLGGVSDLNGSGNLLGLLGSTTPADNFDNLDAVFKPVPEPSTLLLLGAGLVGLGAYARRRASI